MLSSFGQSLRGKRVAAGKSLREVAAALGVTHVYLGEVERGQRGPLPEKYWAALVGVLPNLTLGELRREAGVSRPVEMDVANAPRKVQNLALALARRINNQAFKEKEIDQLLQILGVEDE